MKLQRLFVAQKYTFFKAREKVIPGVPYCRTYETGLDILRDMSNSAVMLFDLIEFVSNPFPWHLAPMGYVSEVRKTAQRARETGDAWDSHLAQTRSFIEQSAGLCPNRRRVVVVGSGNLLDVPLDCLADMFADVVLLDIFHTRETRRRVRQKGNVTLLDADVTGVAREVFDAARRRDLQSLPKSMPPALDVETTDLIVSVNLLSQLAVIPNSFLQGRCPGIAPETLSAFARHLIQAHLAWLSRRATHVCLITDVERIERFANGTMIRKSILEGTMLPPPDRTWDWQIAPRSRVFPDCDVQHRVHAYLDYRPMTGLSSGRGGL